MAEMPVAADAQVSEQITGIESIHSEIVIAFVAPVGVDLEQAEQAVSERLQKIGYRTIPIRVTRDVFPHLDPRAKKEGLDAFTRIGLMMDIGTEARGKFGEDIVALGLMDAIAQKREPSRSFQPKTAFIVHSLKHPAEVKRFREIYPRGFYLIGVHSIQNSRKTHLTVKRDMTPQQADELMSRDKQEGVKHGQQLIQTFHLSDFFVGWATDVGRMKHSLERFVDIVFGDPHQTPSFGEYAMFHAFSASLRSADLSRQVGAVITKDGDILAVGANDCPQAGGGLYWPVFNKTERRFEEFPQGRDSARGYDSNRKEILDIIQEISNDCVKAKIPNEIITKVISVLEKSSVRDLTEFGRVVHAEMEALLSCARNGISTRGATIYCTTFPCHNCAKHIIAAGIKRVVFIEPYFKSKAIPFHDEVIRIMYPEEELDREKDEQTVRFEPFFGVGPRRFFDLFSMNIGVGRTIARKDPESGDKSIWSVEGASPRVQMLQGSYLDLEANAAEKFKAVACEQHHKL